jgi:hypothetical protein
MAARAPSLAPAELVDALFRFDPAVVAHAEAWASVDPVAGGAAGALLALLSSEAADRDTAAEVLRELPPAGEVDGVAGAWVAAAQQWAAGDWQAAAGTLDTHLVANPHDDLALLVGHQLDFFLGDAPNLHRRVARAMVSRDEDDPRRGFLLGMLAFGLEESGFHAAALGAATEAIGREHADVWAIHAGAHVLEMQGQAAEGHDFLTGLEPWWDSGTLLTTHLAWHDALFLLDLSDPAGALARWDERVLPADSPGYALDLVDAAALLWRLHLDGADVGHRLARTAERWGEREPSGWYWFNEWHALMALVGAGRQADAEAWLASAVAASEAGGWALAQRCAAVGPGVGRAIVSFGAGRYAEVVESLLALRSRFHWCGGSHAQRDVLELTLVEAAVRSGDRALARALLGERLVLKPAAPFARSRLADR